MNNPISRYDDDFDFDFDDMEMIEDEMDNEETGEENSSDEALVIVKYCECGAPIYNTSKGKRFCDDCLKHNITQSKLRYEKKRHRASMSEPKRANISRNKALQIIIRNAEKECAEENGITSLSSFNRWANGKGKRIYVAHAKASIFKFLRDYLSPEYGDPIKNMTYITRSVPEIRAAYLAEAIRRQKEKGFKTLGEFLDYERKHIAKAAQWRADLVCDMVKNDLFLLNTVEFLEAGELLTGNANWK